MKVLKFGKDSENVKYKTAHVAQRFIMTSERSDDVFGCDELYENTDEEEQDCFWLRFTKGAFNICR